MLYHMILVSDRPTQAMKLSAHPSVLSIDPLTERHLVETKYLRDPEF